MQYVYITVVRSPLTHMERVSFPQNIITYLCALWSSLHPPAHVKNRHARMGPSFSLANRVQGSFRVLPIQANHFHEDLLKRELTFTHEYSTELPAGRGERPSKYMQDSQQQGFQEGRERYIRETGAAMPIACVSQQR